MPTRPDPDPLETNDVAIVVGGTALWALALLVLLVMKAAGTDVRTWWLEMCLAGVVLGLIGVRYCSRRQHAIARDRASG